jgi:DNA repair exonuclease SbcCD ATPase subunit
MHIRKLSLENIRCFRQLSIDFTGDDAVRPLTILVGANGTGKSTILKALASVYGTDPLRGGVLLGANVARVGARGAVVELDLVLDELHERKAGPRPTKLRHRIPTAGPESSRPYPVTTRFRVT